MRKRFLDRVLGLIGFEVEEDEPAWREAAHLQREDGARSGAAAGVAARGRAGRDAGPAYAPAELRRAARGGSRAAGGGAPRGSTALPAPQPSGAVSGRPGAEGAGARRRGAVVSLPPDRTAGGRLMQVMVITPTAFDEVSGIAENLQVGRPVVVNLEAADRELARRVIDFLSGATYALEGNTQRIGNQIFLFTPANIDVALDHRSGWAGQGGDW